MSPAYQLPTVIRFGRLGDMIMLTALVRLLHARYRRPCQVIGAGPWNTAVFRGHPDVAEVWSFARHFPFPFSLSWPRVLFALRRSAPAPIYIGERQPRQLIRVRRLLASSGVDPARCVFISDEPCEPEEHWVDRLLRFGERTPASIKGGELSALPAERSWAPQLHVLDDERRECEGWIQEQGWSDRELILIQPGNFRSMSRGREQWQKLNGDDKAWPIERWVSLFSMLHRQMPEAVIVLCGASQEVPMLRRIQAAIGMPGVRVAGLSLRELFALCERAHSMISVDTGPAHAAAALEVPLVVLYGAESPECWLPRSAGSPVLAVGGPPRYSRVDQLSVDSVFEAWRSVVRQIRSPVSLPARHFAPAASVVAHEPPRAQQI